MRCKNTEEEVEPSMRFLAVLYTCGRIACQCNRGKKVLEIERKRE
jgi:hypothetical protein